MKERPGRRTARRSRSRDAHVSTPAEDLPRRSRPTRDPRSQPPGPRKERVLHRPLPRAEAGSRPRRSMRTTTGVRGHRLATRPAATGRAPDPQPLGQPRRPPLRRRRTPCTSRGGEGRRRPPSGWIAAPAPRGPPLRPVRLAHRRASPLPRGSPRRPHRARSMRTRGGAPFPRRFERPWPAGRAPSVAARTTLPDTRQRRAKDAKTSRRRG